MNEDVLMRIWSYGDITPNIDLHNTKKYFSSLIKIYILLGTYNTPNNAFWFYF